MQKIGTRRRHLRKHHHLPFDKGKNGLIEVAPPINVQFCMFVLGKACNLYIHSLHLFIQYKKMGGGCRKRHREGTEKERKRRGV